MKRIVACVVLTLPLLILACLLPVIAVQMLPKVEVTRQVEQVYTDTVYATGKIEEVGKSDITYDIPIVPEHVFVEVGDTVKAGDLLATVNVEQTKNGIFELLSLSDKLPQEAVTVLAAMDLDYEKLASVIPTRITASRAGTVTDLGMIEGTMVYPTEVCASISNLGTLRAKLTVPEKDADSLKLDQPVELTVGALEDRAYEGSLSEVFPTAHDTLVGTSQETVVGCYSAISDADGKLKAGYSVIAEIAVGEEQSILCIPYTAVGQDEDGQEYVYVVEDGRAVRQDITTGKELENVTEVSAGLENADWVITDRSLISHSGQRVRASVSVQPEVSE